MKKLLLMLVTFLFVALLAACSTENTEPDADQGGMPDDEALTLQFEATTLNGDTVSDAIFADYQLTMVNVWATFCGSCIAEMPELQELYAELPEGVNMITICTDGESETELAQEIYDNSSGSFMVVLANKDLLNGFLTNITGVPTTVFVDRGGKIIGDFQLGAPGISGEGTLAAKYLALIDDRLQQVE